MTTLATLLELPGDPRAARTARAHVREILTGWGLEDLVDVVQLLTSELVTNVLLHTDGGPRVGLTREGDGVRVTVGDDSPVLPRRRTASPTATTGRGYELLAELSDDWGAEAQGDGKVVWFVVSAPDGGTA